MGLFSKLKQGLGIGTAKVELFVEPSYGKESNQIDGKIKLTAKSDQHILSLKYQVKQKITSGRGEDKRTDEYVIGEIEIKEPFDIKEGESRDIPFSIPFKASSTSAEALKGMGGALGALGKLGSAVSNEKVEYWVSAEADAKGVALDPSDDKRINLI